MHILEVIFGSLALFSIFSITWYTVKTGISPMPSSKKATRTILTNAEIKAGSTIVDLGSGWGALAIAFARKYPQSQVIGYELSWLPWIYSVVRKKILRLDNLQLYRRSFLNAELKDADLLVCYLFPKGMSRLNEKLIADELDVNIVSNTFALPNNEPVKKINLRDAFHTPIYFYGNNNRCQ